MNKARLFIAYQPSGGDTHSYVLYADREMAKNYDMALAVEQTLPDICANARALHDMATMAAVAIFMDRIPGKPKMGYA